VRSKGASNMKKTDSVTVSVVVELIIYIESQNRKLAEIANRYDIDNIFELVQAVRQEIALNK